MFEQVVLVMRFKHCSEELWLVAGLPTLAKFPAKLLTMIPYLTNAPQVLGQAHSNYSQQLPLFPKSLLRGETWCRISTNLDFVPLLSSSLFLIFKEIFTRLLLSVLPVFIFLLNFFFLSSDH